MTKINFNVLWNNSMEKLLSSIFILSFFLISLVPEAEAKIYIDDEYGFWIEYPDNWWFEDTRIEIEPIHGLNDGTIIFPSFRDGIYYWYQFASVTLMKNSTVAMNYEGQEFFDVLINDLKNGCKVASFEHEGYQCSDYTVIDTEITEINGMKAYQITDSWNETYPDGLNFTKVSIVTDIVIGNDLWQIDTIIVESEAELEDVREILTTFKFLEDSKYKQKISQQNIPDWIRNNAGWWSSGQIDDNSFVQGIQWLIKEGIMIIPETQQVTDSGSSEIPDWVRNNAGWWSSGQIDDNSFVQGIQWLIKEGMIKLS